MSTTNHTCKIPIVNSVSLCILNSEWLSTEIILLLLHDNQAWSAKFQLVENEGTTELLDHLSLTRDEYLEETRNALTTHGGAENFVYSLEGGKFTWKKYVRTNMFVKYGIVNLLQVPLFEAAEKVIDHTLQLNLTFFTKLKNSEIQKDALETEMNTLKSNLNELVDKKNEMETTLYSQFLHLLNEKKRKIKELKRKIPAKDSEDMMHSESDHFDSDTEIDSEEEEKPFVINKLTLEKAHIKDEPVNHPKRSLQKRQSESIAGHSGKSSKAENSKVVEPKKKTDNEKKGQRKSGRDSCVVGQLPELNNESLSEASEDAFMFPKRSKRAIGALKTVKPSTSKIKYESDDDTDIDNVESLGCDLDKTLCQINEAERVNEAVELVLMEKNGEKSKSMKQEIGCQSVKSNVINNEPKTGSGNTEVTTNTSCRGLSSSTLEILNQLI